MQPSVYTFISSFEQVFKMFCHKKKVSSLFRKLAIFQKMKMKSSYKRNHHTIIYVQKLTKKTDIKIDIGYFVTAIESK